MTITVKLAHLSDLHLTQNVEFWPCVWNLKRCLGYLNWWRKRRFVHSRLLADKIFNDILKSGVTHLALTGDITNLGLPKEHSEAKIWLENKEPYVPISLIPGNHDIYSRPEDRFSCLQNWDAFTQSDIWGQNFFPETSQPFPFLKRIGPLVLIGLNSAYPTVPFKADGILGEPQLCLLERLLFRLKKEALLRVVLIHHPPLQGQTSARRALKDANKLEHILSEQGAELILHGHNHRASFCWLTPKHGNPIPIVGVGSGSSAYQKGEERLASYHLFNFEITNNTYEISMTVRGLKSKEGEVVDLSCWKVWPYETSNCF